MKENRGLREGVFEINYLLDFFLELQLIQKLVQLARVFFQDLIKHYKVRIIIEVELD